MVRSDMTGQGLGSLLTGRIIDYCRRRGVKEIFGEVLRENRPMLKICDDFGFRTRISPCEPNAAEFQLML